MPMLNQLAASPDSAVAAAATEAAAEIQRQKQMWDLAQNVWFGLSLGSVLLLAAIGLAITFGVMGVINMAHGELVMLGAYTTFVVQEWIRNSAPGLFDWSLLIAAPLAFLVAGAPGEPGNGSGRTKRESSTFVPPPGSESISSLTMSDWPAFGHFGSSLLNSPSPEG